MNADRLGIEVRELLAEVRSAGRGAFRSTLDEILDRRLPGLVLAHDPHAASTLSDGVRQRLRDAASATCAQAREEGSGSRFWFPRAGLPWQNPWRKSTAWGFATVLILLAGLAIYTWLIPKREFVAQREIPGVTGPKIPVPRAPTSKPQGPAVKRSPEIRIEAAPVRRPRSRESERERFAVRERPIVGELGKLTGDPIVRRADGTLVPPRVGAKLELGSTIDTGDMGRVEVKVKHGSTLTLGFNTVLSLRSESGRDFELKSGSLVASVVRTEALDTFIIETPVATAEVLGTEFSLGLERREKLQAVLQVKSGRVAFFNDLGRIEAQNMMESTAVEGSAPTEPKRVRTLREFRFLLGAKEWFIVIGGEKLEKLAAGRHFDYDRGSAGFAANDLLDGKVRVFEVVPGSPADRSGLRVGDIVTAVDGRKAASAAMVQRAVFEQPGRKVLVSVDRQGERLSFSLISTRDKGQASSLPPGETQRLRRATLAALFGDRESAVGQLKALSMEAPSGPAFNNLGVAYELGDGESDLRNAILSYQMAVRLAPRMALYRLNLGLALQQIGNMNRAIEEMEAAVALDPSYLAASLDLARARTIAGRFDDALAGLEDAMKHNREHQPIWNMKCYVLTRAGRLDDAITAGERAIELNPQHFHAHFQLGRALKFRGRFDEAEREYTRSIELDPTRLTILGEYGSMLSDRGRNEEAEEVFRRSIALDPNFVAGHNKLGLLLAKLGRLPEAEHEFREAIRLDPKADDIYVNLGIALGNQGRRDEALRAYEHAVRLNPLSAMAYYNWGVLYYRQRRYSEALPPLQKAVNIEPERPLLSTVLASTLEQLGRREEAAAVLQSLTIAVPTSADAYHSLGRVLQQLSKSVEAEAAFRKALELNPGNSHFHIALADLMIAQKKFQETLSVLEVAVKRHPNDAHLQSMLGWSQIENHRWADAVKSLRKCLELEPNGGHSISTLGNLGYALIHSGDLIEAEKVISKAMTLQPESPDAYGTRSYLLAHQGANLDEALQLAKKVTANPNAHAWYSYLLGFVYVKRGEFDLAVEPLKRAVHGLGRVYLAADAAVALGQAYEAIKDIPAAIAAYRCALQIEPRNEAAVEALKRVGGW